MPRSVRKTPLETRTARLSNPIRRAPYYVKIAKGLHLRYYRGGPSGSWVAREADIARTLRGHRKLVAFDPSRPLATRIRCNAVSAAILDL